MTAGGYGCEFCGGQHPVNWLVTRLAPADTIPLCAEDFPVGIIPLLAVELGVDVQRLYDAIKRFVDREQAREAKAETKAASVPPQPPMTDDMAGKYLDHVKAKAEYEAAKALLDDPSTYEDGNTEYGLEQALELARQLVAEYEAAQ